MPNLLEKPPTYEFRRGHVIIKDEYGCTAMSLGDFAADASLRLRLSRQWIAEANERPGFRRLKKVQKVDPGH